MEKKGGVADNVQTSATDGFMRKAGILEEILPFLPKPTTEYPVTVPYRIPSVPYRIPYEE